MARGSAAAAVPVAGAVAGLGYYLVVTGKLTIDTGWGRRVRPLGPFGVEIAAPVATVFDVIAAPYLGRTPNGLALSDYVRAEQVELDFPGDVGDAGLAGLAGGEVAGFLGLAGAGPVRPVADEGGGGEDLEQERGKREIGPLRGEKPRRYPSRRPGRAGS